MATALITGATSGIGREIAWQLAAERMNLILVARSADRLEEVAEHIRQVADVEVEVLPADLSQAEGTLRVCERLIDDERPVGLLVNNAGFAVGQDFVSGSIEQERRALAVMVGAVMELTHAAVPGMVARGHGAVLNVASVTALTAMGTYAAHKAWVRTFTEGLASELRGTGVTATVLNPGLTHTEFHARAAMDESAWPAFVWLQADDVARQALDAVRRGQVICTPSLRYQIANAALRASPRWLVRRVAGRASLGAQATPVGEPSDALAAG